MELWVIGIIGAAVFLVSVAPGMYLWWPRRTDPEARADFGVNLVTAALVALAIFTLQILFEMRLDRVDELRQTQAERQNLELTIGLQDALPGIQLAGQQLEGFYFYRKVLSHANFEDANLERATLTGSDLSCADLSRVVLTDATADRVTLEGTELDEAMLAGAVLSFAKRGTTVCDDGDQHPTFQGSILVSAQLDYARLPETSFSGANLDSADLQSARLQRSDFRGARLVGASLENANLNGAYLNSALLMRATLAGADLRGADLRGAQMEGVELDGAKYDSATRWPAGFEQTTCPAAKICRAP